MDSKSGYGILVFEYFTICGYTQYCNSTAKYEAFTFTDQYGIIRNSYLNLQRRPDFGVERVVVDCYTPQYNVNKSLEDNCERIRQKIHLKVNRKKQSDRILLNALNIPTHQLESIESIMDQWIYTNETNYIPNLKELIIVKQLSDRLNYVISLTPTGDCINPSNIIS